jgi:hypothetical protein
MYAEMLVKKYGYNTPILLKEVELEGVTQNNKRQIFARLQEKGLIEKFGWGVYYVPKQSTLLKKSQLGANQVLHTKFIANGDNIKGYYAGLTFANQIGLTTQMPVIKEIVTNEESSKRRIVQVGKVKVITSKPRNHIADYNWEVLQFLDLINRINKIGIELNDENDQKLRRFIADKKLERNILNKYIGLYPAKVSKFLIERRLIDEFAS